MNGFLIVNKPVGCTSMDVIRHIRRVSGVKKVGHAGTLDPLASGVLIVCLGTATKLIEDFMAMGKTYRAGIDLSARSGSDDAEGPLTPVENIAPITQETLCLALTTFVGTIMQVPPTFSAVSVGGKKAYAQARKGKPIALSARPVHIDSIELCTYTWPRLTIDIACGKGTYIRSLARDLGQTLETGGYLCALERTSIGKYTSAQAAKPADLYTAQAIERFLKKA